MKRKQNGKEGIILSHLDYYYGELAFFHSGTFIQAPLSRALTLPTACSLEVIGLLAKDIRRAGDNKCILYFVRICVLLFFFF